MSGKVAEIAVEQAIKLFLKTMGKSAGEFSPFWTKGAVAYYAPHIKVLTKILLSDLKYRSLWTDMGDLRRAADKYAEELDEFRRNAGSPPSPGSAVGTRGGELVGMLDGLLVGTLELIRKASLRVKNVDAFIGQQRPKDPLELLFGEKSTVTARNDGCFAAKGLVLAAERLLKYRNEWARAVSAPAIDPNLRRKVVESCPESTFYR